MVVTVGRRGRKCRSLIAASDNSRGGDGNWRLSIVSAGDHASDACPVVVSTLKFMFYVGVIENLNVERLNSGS